MKPELIVPIAIAIISGGALTGAGALVGALAQRRKSHQDDERLPAEVGSLWLGGAEKAVGSLQIALDRAEAQISRLEAAVERKDQRIETLESDLQEAREQMSALQTRLDRLGVRISELRDDENGTDDERV